MRVDLLDYYYESALALLKGGRIFGEAIDLDNSKEIIASLYIMYLHHDQLYKEKEREFLKCL